MKIIDRTQSYTFSKYFDMKIDVRDLAEEFGYNFSRNQLNLPQFQGELNRIKETKERIKEVLPYVSLNSETARREMLISPIIFDLIHYTKSEVRIEYLVKVNEQLQGYFDYLIEKELLVIEAKKGDLDYGFTQLTSQLIALDQWEKMGDQEVLIGAITTGNIWQFGRLNRQQKHIEQGLDLYRVPDDLEPLMRILVQALS
ncbi:hypothetical protein ACN4EE_01260 [Geminocystis sp. CENA526]|uniref:hypothetical protein n=1 Tax=Geminocystis sp. CENA526 TaxID=1355871 RepID=UPI003D6DBCC3